jgi:hypothetical protein
VTHAYIGGQRSGGSWFYALPEKIAQHPMSKISSTKRAGGVVQEVEYLPRKCEALSSSPTTAKKKKNKEYIQTGTHSTPSTQEAEQEYFSLRPDWAI